MISALIVNLKIYLLKLMNLFKILLSQIYFKEDHTGAEGWVQGLQGYVNAQNVDMNIQKQWPYPAGILNARNVILLCVELTNLNKIFI